MKRMTVVSSVIAVILAGAIARAEDNASISGKISFAGDAPKAKKLKMDADPQCAALHADKPATSEEVVVNANGTLKNVFVYLKSGVTGTYPKPATPVMINQKGCTYDPHVFGMQAGQMILIKNSDDTLHNIHALPNNNEEFNKGQPAGSVPLVKAFRKPEVMVRIKCDVHPWMTAYVGVLEHPFFAVTGPDGKFELKGLPPGTYTIEAWQEKLGTTTASVTIGAKESKEVAFTFKHGAAATN